MMMNAEKLKQLQDQVRIGGKVCTVYSAVQFINFLWEQVVEGYLSERRLVQTLTQSNPSPHPDP